MSPTTGMFRAKHCASDRAKRLFVFVPSKGVVTLFVCDRAINVRETVFMLS